jgi:uncharacterized membrane protein (DUF2068 family)
MSGTVTRGTRELGLRIIIVFKLAKAGCELVLAAALAVVVAAGDEARAHDLGVALSRHVTGAWSLRLSALLARAAAPRAVELAIVALLLDGVLTLAEGWALYRGFVWAPWIVVLATGSLIPFELFELARRPRTGRLLILVANLAVVGYLAARATRDRAARRV